MSRKKEEERQNQRDQQYRKDTEKWLSEMTPEERAKAVALGITEPLIESQGIGSPELDDSRIADFSHEEDFFFDDPEETVDGDTIIQQATRKNTRAVLCEILDAENARLSVELIAMVTGFGYLDFSPEKLASRFDFTVDEINEQIEKIKGRDGLQINDDCDVDLREIKRAVLKNTRAITSEILTSKNARLSAECLAFVTGIGYLGISETSIADKFKITRSAVSKRCVELTERLGLPVASGMKSEAARESYRESRNGVVAREDGEAGEFFFKKDLNDSE